ncbi:ATP-dependent translocase ABCB1-like [Octopus sinensis]|uniref:ATP-dependent translocase ABCB1-like n=1 Tax=Octopus sinensis TaxID=2607531 RepID=A0A6P7SCB4_9MOLL|nr:ATP-dependent translocase ABCB1-like [Octopus sinensis]
MDNKAFDGSDIQNGKAVSNAWEVNNKESETKSEAKSETKNVGKVSFFKLFRYASGLEIFFMIIGGIAAAVHGVAIPLLIIVFSEMLDSMSETSANITRTCAAVGSIPDSILLDKMATYSLYYVGLAGIVFIAAYTHVTLWKVSTEKQIFYMRKKLMMNILRQNLSWFDEHTPGKLSSYLSDALLKISTGLGNNIGTLLQTLSGTVAALVIAFVYQWKLSLVMFSLTPVLGLSTYIMTRVTKDMTEKELNAYAEAGNVAEEAISSIRTVVAFGGEGKECSRYEKLLGVAKKASVKKGFATGVATGFFWFSIFGYYALGFWYAAKIIREDNYRVADVLIAFFSVVTGGLSLGQAGPAIQSISEAQSAAFEVFNVLDTEPSIDNLSKRGSSAENINGNIIFKEVYFNYPSRPDVPVLSGLNFVAEPGKTVALVGTSGCGKSTVIQLIQRLYDIHSGEVLIGGKRISEYNVGSLRKIIGVVNQEPVLFGNSIKENIRDGDEKATDADIIAAAKEANAHDFIMQLPGKYNTLVGERGTQLSGGQKQRIAIARALVRKPLFLLLDEATSALDTESERIVQSALDKVQSGRTTLVVAHRLSTIRSADMILAFKGGVIVERGTHEELMKQDGLYASLVMAQRLKTEGTEESEGNTTDDEVSSSQRQRLKSISSVHDGETHDEASAVEEEKDLPEASAIRIFKMNSPEWPYILMGLLASAVNGAVIPAFSVIFSEFIGAFQGDGSAVNRFALLILMLAAFIFVGYSVQYLMFGISGEKLTLKLRAGLFKAILRQEISWFDKEINNTGVLCSRLAVDSARVKGATGVKIGLFIQSLTNIGSGIVIAFVYGWQLALLIIGFLPILAFSAVLETKLLTNTLSQGASALEEATNLSMEAFQNIKTVLSLSIEMKIYEKFHEKILLPYKNNIKGAFKVGIAFSFSQSVVFLCYAAVFYVGALLITKCEMDFVDLLKVFGAIVFGAFALGQVGAVAPDFAKVKTSSARIMDLLDRVPAIDSYSQTGKICETFESKIQFKDVEFEYPNRANVKVLQGLSLEINQGETVALVGKSGCGKSTCMQLIEKFYNPSKGEVFLDSINLKELNTSWLRRQIAIVSQEPVLFSCSIEENIAYGDLTRAVTFDEIINAAQQANIHSFIQSLPEGYSTKAGGKGSQLSGGQKQRIAIARALIRNPKILLLDEATSALDTESEKVVQEALDKARSGRTCLVVAHRLSTIKDSDRIAVVVNGKVHEIGTHTELDKKKDVYFDLLNNQNL